MTFSLDWLNLREPADHAARDQALLSAAAGYLRAAAAPVSVDLGAGSGSTVRAFGALAEGVCWRLIDRDPALLAAASGRLKRRVDIHEADLADIQALPLTGARLITASALFDLVSVDWLERLTDRIASERLALYATLTYDGTTAWKPAQPEDSAVLYGFNSHQRSDKGFGPALGPEAGAALQAALVRRGYDVKTASSPWRLEPSDGLLQAKLAEGIALAAHEVGVEVAASWGQARRASAIAGASSCTVGHIDVLAFPA